RKDRARLSGRLAGRRNPHRGGTLDGHPTLLRRAVDDVPPPDGGGMAHAAHLRSGYLAVSSLLEGATAWKPSPDVGDVRAPERRAATPCHGRAALSTPAR